jgi:hypothetical protein
MKFSDMMGKGKESTEEADAETEAVAARLAVPPPPEAPIRFGTPPEVAQEAPAAIDVPAATDGLAAPDIQAADTTSVAYTQPAIAEVMAELTPRKPEATVASNQQLDATAWLEGLATIDDDMLPG